MEKAMTRINLGVTGLVILLVSISLPGVWENTYGQAGPGNWEFFASPTRNPVEPRWGSYKDEVRSSREEAAAKHNYCPTSGCVVRLDKLAVTPNQVKKGQEATIVLTYTVLTAEDIGIPVTISREIFYQGKSLGKTSSRNMRTPNGSFDQQVAFTVPDNSPAGQYTLKTRISTGYGQDEKSVNFNVN
jgi:hypothetical protein